jgi:rRNA-processing protein FCF1
VQRINRVAVNWKNVTLKVILDANFLFVPLQFKIDVFEGITQLLNQKFEPILLSTTRRELQRMADVGSPQLRKQAVVALKLAEKCTVIDVKKRAEETDDGVILRIASEWKSAVATNDRELRKRLRDRNVPVIFLRGKNRFDLEGGLG